MLSVISRYVPSLQLSRRSDVSRPTRRLPMRRLQLLWQWIHLLTAMCAIILTPIIIGILQQYNVSSPVVIFGHVCDMLFAVDVFASKAFRVKRRRARAQSSSWLSLASASPLAIVPLMYSLGGGPETLAWCCIFRMIVVCKLPPLYRTFKQVMEEYGYFIHETYVRVVMAFVFAAFYSSMLACIWFSVSCRRRDVEGCLLQEDSWVALDSVMDIKDPSSRYIRSLHFIVQTLFTIGYGDIFPINNNEIVFTLFLILNGSLFYAFMISSITSLLSNRDATTKLYRSETNAIKDFFASRGVSSDISEQIQGYFDFLFTRKKGVLDSAALAAVPSSLARAVKASFVPCLEQVPFFQAIVKSCTCFDDHSSTAVTVLPYKTVKCSSCGGVDVLTVCSEELSLSNYVPGAALVTQGDAHRSLFLILSGRVDILRTGSKCALMTLRTGDHIGSEALFMNSRWSLSVVAAEYTEVACLDISGLLKCLQRAGALNALGVDSIDPWLSAVAGGAAMAATVKAAEGFQRQCRVVQTNMSQTQQKKKILQMLEKTDIVDDSWTILPSSLFRFVWEVIYMVGIVYYLISVPLRLVILIEGCAVNTPLRLCISSWHWSLLCDYFFDVVMVATMVLHAFFFAFVQLEGSVQHTITDHRMIFERFVKSKTFFVLLMLVIPADFLAIQFGYLSCFRLTKLTGVVLLPDAVGDISAYLTAYLYYTISSEAITIVHLTYVAAFLSVWMSSCWSIITHIGPDITYGFLDSIFWTLTTMTTVGYGDIVPQSNWETFYVVIACIAGPCMGATIIANTASFMKNDDSSENNVSHRKSVMQAFVSSHRPRAGGDDAGPGTADASTVPARGLRLSDPVGAMKGKDVRIAAVEYFDMFNSAEMSGMGDGHGVSADGALLCPFFENHMKQHLIGDIVQASEVFTKLSPFIMRKIVALMEPQYFSKGGLVLSSGEPTKYIYFVKNGVVQVYNQHGKRTQRLLQGDCFGLSALLPGYHVVAYRATAFKSSELWVLSRKNYEELAGAYPEEFTMKNSMYIEEVACKNMQRITDPLAPAIKALRHINNLREPNKTFVEPDSVLYALWCVVQTVFVLYNGFMVPARLAFGEQVGFNYTFVVDYFGDLLFVIDIFLNAWVLGYYDKDDLVLVRDRIQENYIQKGNFIYNLLSVCPTDLICVVLWSFRPPNAFSISQILSICRVNRLLRVIDVKMLLCHIERALFKRISSTNSNLSTDITTEGLNAGNVIRLGKLVFLVLYATHFVGCAFFVIANMAHLGGTTNNWADAMGILRLCSFNSTGASMCNDSPSFALIFQQYVYAFYWATATISTVGYGDIVAVSSSERIYNVLVFLVGTSVYAMAVVHLQDIVAQLNVTSGIFKSRCDRITAFLQREGVPEHVFAKNKAYTDKLWTSTRGASGKELQQFLPQHLYGRLLSSLSESALSSLCFIKYCPPNFIHALAAKMESSVYLPPDFVFFTGSMPSRLYLLTNGEVELVSESTGERYALSVCRGNSSGSATPVILGEPEFFQRTPYACGGRVLLDAHCFEFEFDVLWALVVEYKLEAVYKSELELQSVSLQKKSTNFIVSALKGNLKNAKMAKILSTARTEESAPNFFLLPTSPFCQFWTLVSVVVIFYWGISVPYVVAFGIVSTDTVFMDIFGSLFFCFDVYFRLAYFAIEQNGDIITVSSEFRKLYMENDLALDVLSCLPIPLMVLGLTENYLVYAALRCLHVFKLRKVSSKLSQLISFIEPIFKIRFPENVLRIVRTVAMVWYFGHVICCMFCLIGSLEIGNSVSWLEENNVADKDDLTKYLWGYLWSMYTVVTVGYGNVMLASSGERILAIVTMISGAILCDAGVAAVLSSMVDAQDRQSGVVKRQFDGVDIFCRNHCSLVSTELAKSMMSYFNYLNQSLGDHEEQADISILPPAIWLEIVRRVSFRSLCAVGFIDTDKSDLKLGFVNSLLRFAEPYIAYPGQVLGGKDSNDIFILRRGKMYSICENAGSAINLRRRSSVGSLASSVSEEQEDDFPENKRESNREYQPKGLVIYKKINGSGGSTSGRRNSLHGKSQPLAKSVFVTVVSVFDFQDSACYSMRNQESSRGNGASARGHFHSNEMESRAPNVAPAAEKILRTLNSFLSRGVSSYVRLTCGAQRAKTTTEIRRGGATMWKKRRASGNQPGTSQRGDAPVDIHWNQNFQFEVPADTNTLKLSLLISARNSAELADRSIGTVVVDLNTLCENDTSFGESLSVYLRQEDQKHRPIASPSNSNKESLHSTFESGRQSRTPFGSVLPTPAPPIPENADKHISVNCVKYMTATPEGAPVTLNDGAFINSVNDTLHTIDFAEGPSSNTPNFNGSFKAASAVAGRQFGPERQIADSSGLESDSCAGSSEEASSETTGQFNFIESEAKPNVTYNSFTYPKEEVQKEDAKAIELADRPRPFVQANEAQQNANDIPVKAEHQARKNSQNGTLRQRNRRGTLSFKSRNLVLDIRSNDGMYVGKIEIKLSVRASLRDTGKREHVKRMFGADEKVSVDDGGYYCESFCHLLRIPKEKIEELQMFYKSVDLPVSSRIDEMISAARAKENQSPRKPRDESLEASLPLPLPEDCTGDKAKCDGDISKERIRAKISPTFSILSAVRYMGSLRYKHSEHAERNGLQNTLGSATILQSRHSSSVASYSQDEKSFIADSRGNSAVPSLPSPRAKAVGISACESEEGAYLYRAGRTTLEEDQNK